MKYSLPNIFIIGPFGSGKSTIGRALAKRLKRDFYDTDRLLETRLGVDISWLFDIEGASQFLQREHMLLQELVTLPNIVLSTGGSTILSEENRKILTDHGFVIALSISLAQQLQRTQFNKYRRPILRGNPMETEKRLHEFKKFDALYRRTANISFSTDHKSIYTVTHEIMDYLSHFHSNSQANE